MGKKSYERIYEWEKLTGLLEEFVPEIIDEQINIKERGVVNEISKEAKEELLNIGFSPEARDAEDVARQVIDKVYPYSMKSNHPRNFCFIPNDISPYSVFGEIINSLYNPYGGGFSISGGTAALEEETIRFMGSLVGYDEDKLGGQFVSGGSMANLTAMIVARDDKLDPEEVIKGTVYVSDQTHSSVAKGVHIMGVPAKNVRAISTIDDFTMDMEELKEKIDRDIENGYKPFLLVGTSGTTNTGAIDPLHELADIAEEYDLWYHVDGAYGGSALMSSHKDLLDGIERSDSVSWDGHKWLYQTYGCAAIICRDKYKLLDSFHVNPEYLKDVESTDEEFNFWDMGIELTKPARGMKLWFTLQTVGLDAMGDAIDRAFVAADWIEDEVKKYDNFEIISHSNMGIVNFRYINDKYSEEELDEINRRISQRAIEENYSAFLTTQLKGKIVLRFCTNHPLITQEEIVKIISDIQLWIEEMEL